MTKKTAATLPPNATHPKTRAAWRKWLEKHHTRDTGVWLVSFKSKTGKPRVEYGAAVEEALCFGWIDSKAVTLDDDRGMQWFSPRRPRTGWSKLNKGRIERMMSAGLMHASGLAKIAQAKKDGSWELFDDIEQFHMPDDLVKALALRQGARALFDAFPPSRRKAILAWIKLAKRPGTRATRVAEAARLAAENRRANTWTPKPRATTPSTRKLR